MNTPKPPILSGRERSAVEQSDPHQVEDAAWFCLWGWYEDFEPFFDHPQLQGRSVEIGGAKCGIGLPDVDNARLLTIDHSDFALRVHLPNCVGTDYECDPILIMRASGDYLYLFRWIPISPECKIEILKHLPIDKEEKALLRLAI